MIRGLLGLWLCAFLATIGLGFALASGWRPDLLAALLEFASAELLSHELRIGELRGNLFDGLEASQLSLQPLAPQQRLIPGVDRPDRLEVARLRVVFDARRSVREGRVTFRSVEVEGAHLLLIHQPEAPENDPRPEVRRWRLAGLLPRPPQPGDEAKPRPDFVMRRIRARDTSIEVLELRPEAPTPSRRLRARVDLEVERLVLVDARVAIWPRSTKLEAVIDALEIGGQQLGSGEIVGQSTGRRLHIERAGLHGPAGDVGLEGDVAMAGPPSQARLEEMSGAVQFERLDLSLLTWPGQSAALPPSALAGTAKLGVSAATSGDIDDPGAIDVKLDLALQPSLLAEEALLGGALQGTWELSSGAWTVDHAMVAVAAGGVEATASGRRREVAAAQLEAVGLDLARLPRRMRGDSDLRGALDAQLELTGPVDDLRGLLTARGRGLHYQGIGPATLDLAVRLEPGHTYRLEDMNLEVPHRKAQDGRALFLRSTASATVELLPGGARVDDLALEWNGGSFRVTGGVEEQTLVPTHIDLERLEVALLPHLLGIDDSIGGVLSGQLDLHGRLPEPNLLARVSWQDPRYRGLSADRMQLVVESNGRQLQIDASLVQGGRPELALSGHLRRPADLDELAALRTDPSTALTLHAEDFDLAWLDPLLSTRGLAITGRLDGALQGRGAPDRPRVDGALTFSAVRMRSLETETADPSDPAAVHSPPILDQLGAFNGDVTFRDSNVTVVDMQVGENGSEARLSADLEWHGDVAAPGMHLEARVVGVGFTGRGELSGRLDAGRLQQTRIELFAFDAAELMRLAEVELDVGGDLSAEIELEGQLSHPTFQLHLLWNEPRIEDRKADHIEISAQSNTQEIRGVARFARRGRRELVADVSLPLDPASPLSAQLAAAGAWLRDPRARAEVDVDRFDLAWLGRLAPSLPIRTRGRVGGHVSIRGADPMPLFTGELGVRNGIFGVLGQKASVGPLDGDVVLSGDRAELDHFTLSSSRGTATLSGKLHWRVGAIDDVLFEIDFNRYHFNQLGLLRADLNGRVTATGAIDALVVNGDIELSDLRVSLPSAEDPIMKEIRVADISAKASSGSISEGDSEIAGIGESARVNVRLSLPSRTWVRGMGLDAEVKGEIQVAKAVGAEPRYAGTLEVEQGRYTLQGKRFELRRGVAVFGGSESVIPDVDIIGVRQVAQDVRVTAHLTGPANAPVLELTSEPPMDTAEIVSFVFFGRSQNDTGDGGSTDLSATAYSAIGGLLLNNISSDVRETLRIDQISLVSGKEGEPPAVEIETQVTPDVFLRLIQSLGNEGDEAVEVRWRFWKDLSFESQVRRSGASSIDLLWSHDFWGFKGPADSEP